MRARRSCLSVPGSSPKFLAKAAGLPADEVFFDLEDSVAPLEKEAARDNIIEALKNNTFRAPTKIVRINGVYTKWAYRDIITLAENVGDLIDGFMIPKVETANDVTFVADLLRMIEDTTGLSKKLGLEVQIETALGLQNIREIAAASDRTEDLILGPADM
ncbi:MAG TPA: aldolase/citrate lyase family protein, partial [Actinomycetota bacterium]|nr:aldolase/citrate lyase family protein [Actinomycetota bacterium]